MSDYFPKGELVIQTLAMPADTNANGDVFGGWVLSQMDLGAGICAKRLAHSKTATVAIDSMSFCSPIFVGDIVSCYAQLLKTGRTSMKILVETWATREPNRQAIKVTEGVFTMVAINDQGKPHPVDPNARG